MLFWKKKLYSFGFRVMLGSRETAVDLEANEALNDPIADCTIPYTDF